MSASRTPDERSVQPAYRSWGETQIARMLDRYGLSFRYEQPAAVVDRGKARIWYPDFHLSDQGIFIEYCGRAHDPSYTEGIARKEAAYAENGITALMITPDVFRGPWPSTLLDQIDEVLTQRLTHFRDRRHIKNRTPSASCFEATRRE